MGDQHKGVESLPLGRATIRIVNQRAQLLSQGVCMQLREHLRIKACEAIAGGHDVRTALDALRLAPVHFENASATTAASVVSPLSTPPVGTPGAVAHGGNSTPARALVAGAGKSPGFGPVSGE